MTLPIAGPSAAKLVATKAGRKEAGARIEDDLMPASLMRANNSCRVALEGRARVTLPG
jgi:hypothetical protein